MPKTPKKCFVSPRRKKNTFYKGIKWRVIALHVLPYSIEEISRGIQEWQDSWTVERGTFWYCSLCCHIQHLAKCTFKKDPWYLVKPWKWITIILKSFDIWQGSIADFLNSTVVGIHQFFCHGRHIPQWLAEAPRPRHGNTASNLDGFDMWPTWPSLKWQT